MGTEIDGVNGIIKNTTSDGDITIKGNDGGSEISALVLDMSAAGAATFNNKIVATELDISGNVDVDGTTNLDVVDIDGAVNMATTALVTGVLTTTAATVFNGGFASNAASTITTADNTDTLSLISTDADDNSGPNLRMYRNSGSPADNDVIGQIQFEGRNDNSQDVVYNDISMKIQDASDGIEDGIIRFRNMQAGTLRQYLATNGTEVAINADAVDLDLIVSSSGKTNMLFVDGGNNKVGVGDVPDLGFLHVKSSDSGASVNANRDDLVLENSGHCGMTILSGTSNVGGVAFGDSGNNLMGLMQYNHATNNFEFNTNSSATPLILNDTGNISTNGEVAPDVDAGGLCLNQGTADAKILTLKSTGDVVHGMTSIAETDTYAYMSKGSGDAGGLQLDALTEGTDAFTMHAYQTTTNTAKSTSADAAIMFKARKKSSASAGSLSDANSNIMAIADHNTRRFLFDIEGDFHADSSSTTFDTYEDAQLVRAYDLSHGKGVINSQFDKYVQYQHEDLADAGLVGREDDGTPNHFINVTGFQRLHNGAIWQQYEKHQRLAKAVYELAKVAVGEDKANEILEQNEIKLLN